MCSCETASQPVAPPSVAEVVAALPSCPPAEVGPLLAALAAAQDAGDVVPPAGVLDAVVASARATASLQAQQFRWTAAFGRPGVAVPIAAVLTALCNGPGVAFLGLPAEEDFEPGKAWE